MRLDPMRLAPVRSAPLRLAPLRSALLRSDLLSLAPMKLAPPRLAPPRLAPLRLAPIRFATMRLALLRFAALRSGVISGLPSRHEFHSGTPSFSRERWSGFAIQFRSTCQFLLQFPPMPLHQLNQQRRHGRSAAYLQRACEGHTI